MNSTRHDASEKIKRLAKSDKSRVTKSGQAVLEYILLLGIVAVIVTGISRTFIKTLDRSVLKFGAAYEKKIKTGRTPVSVWTN